MEKWAALPGHSKSISFYIQGLGERLYFWKIVKAFEILEHSWLSVIEEPRRKKNMFTVSTENVKPLNYVHVKKEFRVTWNLRSLFAQGQNPLGQISHVSGRKENLLALYRDVWYQGNEYEPRRSGGFSCKASARHSPSFLWRLKTCTFRCRAWLGQHHLNKRRYMCDYQDSHKNSLQ